MLFTVVVLQEPGSQKYILTYHVHLFLGSFALLNNDIILYLVAISISTSIYLRLNRNVESNKNLEKSNQIHCYLCKK